MIRMRMMIILCDDDMDKNDDNGDEDEFYHDVRYL